MPEYKKLSPAADWVELTTTAQDWAEADADLLGTLLSHLHLIRGFEEAVLELAGRGLGPRTRPFQCWPGGRSGRFDCLVEPRRTSSTARTVDITNSFPNRWPTCRRKEFGRRIRSEPTFKRFCNGPWPRSSAWPRVSAVAAAVPCICAGPRPERWVPTRSSAAVRHWPPVPPGRAGRPAPTRLRSPTSATERSTSARSWKR